MSVINTSTILTLECKFLTGLWSRHKFATDPAPAHGHREEEGLSRIATVLSDVIASGPSRKASSNCLGRACLGGKRKLCERVA